MADLKITDRMLDVAKSNKCVGWLYLDPVQFLSLTVTDHNVYDWIEKELPHTKTIDEYNSYETLMPWLDVDMHTGKVVGHEGRHRAAACIKSGVKRIPVAICLRDHGHCFYYKQPYIDDYNNPKQLAKVFVTKEDVPKVLVGQFVHRSLLIDTKHIHEFWAPYNSSAIVASTDLSALVQSMSETAQGKAVLGEPAPPLAVAKFIATHSVTAGSVLLFGSQGIVSHAVLSIPDSEGFNPTENEGYYVPSENGYRLKEHHDLLPLIKQVTVGTLLHPTVESSMKLRVLPSK